MKKSSIFLVLIFLSGLQCFAQSPTPTPKPAADDDVVKISTTLIQVDVTVTDKSGKVITDLKPADFEIYENGEKQTITNFSFVQNAVKAAPEKQKPDDKTNVPPPPNAALKSEQVRRTIALVVDDLSLSFESTNYVKRALKKFVNEQMQDGDLVAIIRTGAGIGALQQFTSDKRQLLAAIEKVRWNPIGTGNVGAFAPIQNSPADNADDTDDAENASGDSQIDFNNFRESVFATGTLGAISFIVRGMKDLPGRKSVMLLSDGFQLFSRDTTATSESSRVLDALRRLVDLANRASVVIYTMDARGLQTLSLTAEDDVNGFSQTQIEQQLSDRRDRLFDTQEGLIYLARETGGTSIRNTNDLSGGIEKMLNDQSYYLIGYQPDSDTFDAVKRRFNKFTVKVNRKNVLVRYRSGFFGVSDEEKQPLLAQTPAAQIKNALVSPFAVNDISLRLNTLFGSDAKQGSFVRSLLYVNAKDLKFSDASADSKKAVFDVLAVSFDSNGAVVDQISKSYTLTLKNSELQKLINEGFVYYFTFPVKKPGAYQYRVAIYDEQSRKVGSANQFIEVPNLKKNNLTLSGIVLENLSREDWQKLEQNAPVVAVPENDAVRNSLTDSSLRHFKRGTVLRYGFEIYNAKRDAANKLNLTTQVRLFRDGKQIFAGKNAALELLGQTDLQRIKSSGAISLGSEMEAGEYILQIVAFDAAAKEKRKIATQFVQFEIVE